MASITWLRTVSGSVMTMYNESSKLEDGRNFEITTNQISSHRIMSTFSIASTLATDSGNYTCRASNRLGTADSTQSMVSVFGKYLYKKILSMILQFHINLVHLLLFVHYVHTNITEAPNIVISRETEEFTTNEGTDISFTCTATGSPSPSISFMYEGQSLTRTDGRPTQVGASIVDRVMLGEEMMTINNTTQLYEVTRVFTLFDVAEGDSVNFTCLASADIPGTGTRTDSSLLSLLVYRKLSLSVAFMTQDCL